MVRKIIQIGDERLLKQSEYVKQSEIKSAEIQSLITDLLDTVEKHKKSAAGLSGVQIGVLKRICVVKDIDSTKENKTFTVMINPEITKFSREKSTEWEGCMSISAKNLRLFGPVERSEAIQVTYLDAEGKSQKMRVEGFYSHLIQHEVDHMNGKLFLSYIDNPENIWNEKQLDEYLLEHGKFPKIKR